MRKIWILLFFWGGGVCGIAPNDCGTARVFIDPDYAGMKYLYDTPGGKIVKKLQHDIRNGEYVLLTLLEKNDSMFHVQAEYSGQGDSIGKGWIKKDKTLGIYFKKEVIDTLSLYRSPDREESIVCILKGEDNAGMYTVIDFIGNWLKVRKLVKGKVYEGWMAPTDQWDNVYTTCS